MDSSKKPDLYQLARALSAAQLPYAVIGGVALQIHQDEPRTTLDIDIAVVDCSRLPRTALVDLGFRETGRFAHSENWVGPGGTPVQFTDDPEFAAAIQSAEAVAVDDLSLAVLRAVDLLHAKLRAAGDPARRASKRLQDVADALALVEKDASLKDALDARELLLLDRVP